MGKMRLEFYFEWGCDSCLWADDKEALEKYDFTLFLYEKLPLSKETVQRIKEMGKWYQTALNWEYPPDPGPWTPEEYEKFNSEALKLYHQICAELGDEFEVINQFYLRPVK